MRPVTLLLTLTYLVGDAALLAAQSTDRADGDRFEIGFGVGAGTGRFGGPGFASIIRIGGRSHTGTLGAEIVGVFRRERYSAGGAFFPVTPRVRTIPRWAATVVTRFAGPSSTFGKAGIGVGTVGDIDTGVQDAAPLTAFAAFVATAGVGAHLPIGAVTVVPRVDMLLSFGHAVRLTGVMGVALGVF